MNKLPPMKLGIVGQPSSGKDTVAAYLEKKYGFTHFSSGDFFRQYVRENNLGETTRPLLQKVATALRAKYGADYSTQNALKIKTDYLVISGTRTLAEIETLKRAGGKLIAIEAPIENRYQRALERKRVGDNLTMEEFLKQQEAERKNELAHAQNVEAVIGAADYIIQNDSSLEELYRKLDEVLLKIAKEIS